MLKGPFMLAGFGLALNLVLWGVPGMVAASGAAHLILPDVAPTQSQTLRLAGASDSSSVYSALVKLIGAESEALEVAGEGLQQPMPEDLAPRANVAGEHVHEAVVSYLQAAQALVQH